LAPTGISTFVPEKWTIGYLHTARFTFIGLKPFGNCYRRTTLQVFPVGTAERTITLCFSSSFFSCVLESRQDGSNTMTTALFAARLAIAVHRLELFGSLL
jgi:hypothetical protein